jgi:hypothetical protein
MSHHYHTYKDKKKKIAGDSPPLNCEYHPQPKELVELI